jgi:hypothetical protein
MMIKKMADEFYQSLYHLPPNPSDLKEFANKVLIAFLDEVNKNSIGVSWNSGFDGVVFTNRSVEGKKCLQQIKEEFLGQQGNVGDPDIPQGTGASGSLEGDTQVRGLH